MVNFGKVYPLIIPSLLKEKLPDLAGGVGTPRMLYDPERGCWLLFFTGWINANRREVFVAEVNKDFTLENIRKILSAPPTRDAVNVAYNPWIDGYILLTTERGSLHIRHFDKDFNEVSHKCLVEKGMQDCGAGILMLMGKYSEENPNAVIFYPRREKVIMRLVNRVDDLNLLKLSDEIIFSHWAEPNDVIDTFRVNNRLGVLVEYYTDKQSWRSRIAMSGDYFTPEIRALSAPLPVPFNDAYSNFGHPSFTTGPDGVPKVLFSFFMSHAPPFPIVDYSRQWRHEIWVWEPAVDIFDPRTYGRMYDKIVFDKNTKPPLYDLMGAEKIILQVNPKGTVLVLEESSSIKDFLEGNIIENKVIAERKVVIENSLNVLRIRAKENTTVYLTALYR